MAELRPLPSDTVRQALEAAIAPWRRDDAPGFAIGLSSEEGWTWRDAAGLACVQSGVRNTPFTRMRIGSISKQFTCALIFMLAREGRLDLASTVTEHFPELPLCFESVSVRQLMSHTSGIWCHISANTLLNGPAGYPPADDEAVIAMVRRQRELAFAPGERFLYSNGSYVLLTRLIEQLEDRPLEEVLRRRLFNPVGMHSTSLVRSDAALEPGLASLHLPAKSGRFTRGVFPVSMGGEGGVVSTVDDMLRWLAHWEAPTAFAPDLPEALDEPVRLNNGHVQNFRYGVIRDRYRGLDIAYHDGGVAGGFARIARIPAIGLHLALLMNRGDLVLNEVSRCFIDAVLGDDRRDASSDAPPLTGRFHQRGQARVFEFRSAEGRQSVDMAGQVAPLVWAEEDLLACDSVETANIRFRITRSVEGPAVELEDCGHPSPLRPIPDYSEPVTPASELLGHYSCRNTDADAEARWENDELVLVIRGPTGQQVLKLEPLAPDLWTATGRGHATLRAVVEARRPGGAITGLDVATFRVRLTFDRESAG